MLNLCSKIEPWKGLGGITLYDTIENLSPILEEYNAKASILGRYILKYEIKGKVILWFNAINGKCFQFTACKDYSGAIINSNVKIGTPIEEVMNSSFDFQYDDFEEVYVSLDGLYIETDPISSQVLWISVYIKELNDDDFDFGKW